MSAAGATLHRAVRTGRAAADPLAFILSTGLADRFGGFGHGGPETGPWACLELFRAALEGVDGASVAVVTGAPAIAREARHQARSGRRCVHLCVALPHDMAWPAGCPTIPVFGWGYGSIPTGEAASDASQDWRPALLRAGRAICFSQAAAAAIHTAMGSGFPVCVVAPPVPAPLEDGSEAVLAGDFAALLDTATWPDVEPRPALFSEEDDLAEAAAATPAKAVLPASMTPPPSGGPAWRKTARYRLGVTRLHATEWYRDALRDLLPRPAAKAASFAARTGLAAARSAYGKLRPTPPPHPLAADDGVEGDGWWDGQGIVWGEGRASLSLGSPCFAAVLGVWDRSWSDTISAFVWACRADDRATLCIRSHDLDADTRFRLAAYLRRLGPFACRIVLFEAVLTGAEAASFMRAADFYVCASHAEGAPLPLMRFMRAGVPVLGPTHSALADLLDDGCAITVVSSPAHDYWPHDRRERLRTTSHRLDWESLCDGYARACDIVADAGRHARMREAASARIAAVAGAALVSASLAAFLEEAPDTDGAP